MNNEWYYWWLKLPALRTSRTWGGWGTWTQGEHDRQAKKDKKLNLKKKKSLDAILFFIMWSTLSTVKLYFTFLSVLYLYWFTLHENTVKTEYNILQNEIIS